MKTIAFINMFLLILFSCEMPDDNTNDDFNLRGTGKVKTRYLFSSSSVNEPFEFTTYSYDVHWNLKKKLISYYPKPIYSSYTYEYSDKGVLLNKKHYFKEGMVYPDQTESEFILIGEYHYEYRNNQKIEKRYNRRNELTDSTVFSYENNLLFSENHYSVYGNWSYTYEYDSNNNLIKVKYYPDGTYKIHSYKDSRIIKTIEYNQNDSATHEQTYIYSKSDGKVIVETHSLRSYGDFVSERKTYKNGNVIEYIKYVPFTMAYQRELFCYKYEYY